MTGLLSLSTNGYTNTKFLVIISIVISVLIVDFSFSNVSDIINIFTWWGVVVFISIAFAYTIGQYLILQFVKQKCKIIRMDVLHFGQLGTMMMIAHYVLTAVIVLIVVQILMNSYYYTSLLIWNSSISYSIACFLILILALKFFSWYKVNRNPIVLSYGISSVLIAISIASTLIFCTVTLRDLSNKISPHGPSGPEDKEAGHGPDIQLFNQTTMLGEVQTVFTIFHILSFLSLWISTMLLLHPYSQKLGKVKFWNTIGIPIVFYVSIFVIVTPFVQILLTHL